MNSNVRKKYSFIIGLKSIFNYKTTIIQRLFLITLIIMALCFPIFGKEKEMYPSQPIIKNVIDIGVIKPGTEKVKAIFKWTNPTKENLEIERILKSCGCGEVIPSKKIIQAKEEIEFKIFIEASGCRFIRDAP